MPDENFDERISGNFMSEAMFNKVTSRILKDEDHRQRVICIIDEYVDNVNFMRKVKEYAGEEMDARLFTSAKFWITTIVSAVITAGIGYAFGHFIK